MHRDRPDQQRLVTLVYDRFARNGATLEGEPELVDDYVDAHNGGCNSPDQGSPFGVIASEVFCGVSGWYTYQGANYRDTDWFTVTLPPGGVLTITADADYPTYVFELGTSFLQACSTF